MGPRFVFLLFLLISFFINFPQIGDSPPVNILKFSVQIAAYPLEYSTSFFQNQIKSILNFYIRAGSFEKENTELKEKLNSAEAKLLILNSLTSENRSLREALNFSNSNPYSFNHTPAEIIGFADNTIIINRGKNSGVKEGETVISKDGLVGRIGEVSQFSSKVVMITDPSSIISAVMGRTGTYGVVRGGRPMTMDYVPEDASVEAGEMVKVSNASAAYLRGLPIGYIKSNKRKVEEIFQKIEIAPAADFSKLEVLYICRQ